MDVCLFVCLFVCFFVCLFVCLVDRSVGGLVGWTLLFTFFSENKERLLSGHDMSSTHVDNFHWEVRPSLEPYSVVFVFTAII